MSDSVLYPAPGHPALRWIAEIGAHLPDKVQRRMRSAFYVSTGPLLIGSLNSTVVAGVACMRLQNPVFAVLAVLDIVLLCCRMAFLRRTRAPSGPIFATGLIWVSIQAATTWIVVFSGDIALTVIVLASALATIGGIISRNFAAPRYAMIQVMVLDLGFKIPFSLMHPEFIPLIAGQTIAFVLVNVGIINQHRTMTIRAIRGELDNRQMAVTDPLTGLLNRRGLEEAFDRMASPIEARALLYLDLDGFKQVNDRLGHAAGDVLLHEVGQRLRETVGADHTICRLGGDEFLVLLDRLDPLHTRSLAARIIATIAAPYRIEPGVLARVSVSVGAVCQCEPTEPLTTMMMSADRALYAAKAAGKGRCVVYEKIRPARMAG
ncbi:GGDEF domain-containing protein [Methylobacterium sp. E-045]|uniref:GGDEF domain-containing protein n=1 Tax=Methylobacterium sp. E-045 TaxID=2836575 RepID=UPI001FB9B099|nr:GGDEF domain-containing protein [Methylobacterium sp. E-045]MCJ2128493.1 GGDEF domain-containing protein [Methylobacterium sp. E-045]